MQTLKKKAVETVLVLKQQMLSHIVAALQQKDSPDIQRQAVEALGYVGTQEHIELLKPLLDANTECTLRLAAIEALAAIGGEEAQAALISVSSEGELRVHWKINEVLNKWSSLQKQSASPPPPPDDDELVTILN